MSDDRWFLTDGQTQTGPLTLEALREELARPGQGSRASSGAKG